ncbi:unnamed protein product [Ranitomeya imitator]|uniref:Uncharacterized protein n=1 Tax=Ranitomeya imitator TaxID=111125 RepID=A0ABN9MDG4_9NEOB|nr:unnamed protein product [Ranitomeya imitator]
MELCALDTVCAGCSLALAGGLYYLYRRQRAAVRRIQTAARLQVGAELRTLLEAGRELAMWCCRVSSHRVLLISCYTPGGPCMTDGNALSGPAALWMQHLSAAIY